MNMKDLRNYLHKTILKLKIMNKRHRKKKFRLKNNKNLKICNNRSKMMNKLKNNKINNKNKKLKKRNKKQ